MEEQSGNFLTQKLFPGLSVCFTVKRPPLQQFLFIPLFFTGLSLFWTSAAKRGFSLSDAVRLLCKKPAQLCSLDNQKGSLIPGHDADLVIWDPEKEFRVRWILST